MSSMKTISLLTILRIPSNLFICFSLSSPLLSSPLLSSPLDTHFWSLCVFTTFSSLVVLYASSRQADCDTVQPIVLILKKGGVSVNRCHSMTQRLGQVVARVFSSLTSFVLRRPLAVQLGLGLSSLFLSYISLWFLASALFFLFFRFVVLFSVFSIPGFLVPFIRINSDVYHRLPQSALRRPSYGRPFQLSYLAPVQTRTSLSSLSFC